MKSSFPNPLKLRSIKASVPPASSLSSNSQASSPPCTAANWWRSAQRSRADTVKSLVCRGSIKLKQHVDSFLPSSLPSCLPSFLALAGPSPHPPTHQYRGHRAAAINASAGAPRPPRCRRRPAPHRRATRAGRRVVFGVWKRPIQIPTLSRPHQPRVVGQPFPTSQPSPPTTSMKMKP